MIRASAALAFVLLALSVAFNGSAMDQQVFISVNAWASQWPPTLWSCLTIFGDTYVVVVLLVPCLWWRPQVLLNFWLILPLSGLFISVFKKMIASPRPAGLLEPGSFQIIGPLLQNHSYPSGHTFTAFAVLAIVLLSFRRLGFWLPGLLLGSGVALSRLAVGAHWPGDVMAGAALGWLCGIIAHHLGLYLSQRYPVLVSPRLVTWMAVVWLAWSLYLLKVDTAYPLANPLQWFIAVGAAATSALYLVQRARAKPSGSN